MLSRRISRRTWLAATTLASAASAAHAQGPRRRLAAPECYELRRYQLRNGPGAKIAGDYLAELVPALGRAGAKPVGLFQTVIPSG
jgi:hypothetical protein